MSHHIHGIHSQTAGAGNWTRDIDSGGTGQFDANLGANSFTHSLLKVLCAIIWLSWKLVSFECLER